MDRWVGGRILGQLRLKVVMNGRRSIHQAILALSSAYIDAMVTLLFNASMLLHVYITGFCPLRALVDRFLNAKPTGWITVGE